MVVSNVQHEGNRCFTHSINLHFFQNDIHWSWSTDQGLRKHDINRPPGFNRAPPSSPWRSAPPPPPCSALAGQLSMFLFPCPKNRRARCQLKAPRHLCLATQLHSRDHSAQGLVWHARTPACGNKTLKFEQESTGHLGKCWFAYRRKAGWLIWKGTWRVLGVEHVVMLSHVLDPGGHHRTILQIAHHSWWLLAWTEFTCP